MLRIRALASMLTRRNTDFAADISVPLDVPHHRAVATAAIVSSKSCKVERVEQIVRTMFGPGMTSPKSVERRPCAPAPDDALGAMPESNRISTRGLRSRMHPALARVLPLVGASSSCGRLRDCVGIDIAHDRDWVQRVRVAEARRHSIECSHLPPLRNLPQLRVLEANPGTGRRCASAGRGRGLRPSRGRGRSPRTTT